MSSFSTFKTLEDALTHFNVVLKIDKTPFGEKNIVISQNLKDTLAFNMEETAYNISEAAFNCAFLKEIFFLTMPIDKNSLQSKSFQLFVDT